MVGSCQICKVRGVAAEVCSVCMTFAQTFAFELQAPVTDVLKIAIADGGFSRDLFTGPAYRASRFRAIEQASGSAPAPPKPDFRLRVQRAERIPHEDSWLLTCETANECGKSHTVRLGGEIARVIAHGHPKPPSDAATQRANALADKCQTLQDENTRLHAELSRLQRARK